jgi:hypothetical protein
MMKIPTRDQELLGAYLDGELSKPARHQLETRLQYDIDLADAMAELQQVRALLRITPKLKAPRNFTLKPEITRETRGERTRYFYGFRLVSIAASFLLILVLIGDYGGLLGSLQMPRPLPQTSAVHETEVEEFPLAEMPAAEVLSRKVVDSEESIQEGEAVDESGLAESEAQAEHDATEAEAYGVAERELETAEPDLSAEAALGVDEEKNSSGDIYVGEEGEAAGIGDEGLLLEATPIETPLTDSLTLELDANTVETEGEKSGSSTSNENMVKEAEIEHQEADSEQIVSPEPGMGPSSEKWTMVRMIEIGLGIIAIGAGILAFYYVKTRHDVG